jgi:hypothetical protein
MTRERYMRMVWSMSGAELAGMRNGIRLAGVRRTTQRCISRETESSHRFNGSRLARCDAPSQTSSLTFQTF